MWSLKRWLRLGRVVAAELLPEARFASAALAVGEELERICDEERRAEVLERMRESEILMRWAVEEGSVLERGVVFEGLAAYAAGRVPGEEFKGIKRRVLGVGGG